MDFHSIYKQLKEQDISKMTLNNKNNNINFLMKPFVFEHLMYLTDSYTDTTKAYIPSTKYEHQYIDENKNLHKTFKEKQNAECKSNYLGSWRYGRRSC